MKLICNNVKVIDVLVDINRRDIIKNLEDGELDSSIGTFSITAEQAMKVVKFGKGKIKTTDAFYGYVFRHEGLLELGLTSTKQLLRDMVKERVEIDEKTFEEFEHHVMNL